MFDVIIHRQESNIVTINYNSKLLTVFVRSVYTYVVKTGNCDLHIRYRVLVWKVYTQALNLNNSN